ncbi:hypothetical protein [Streptomyces sp. TBY4]|uniref:hypothetical protein n=1 Tax=Streptomyces sp. TBY4 TaxID=2962030 RepID=UPI0020B8797C|nr:hypothetical protein [Streptomyces sp. TBY4]MCP3755778.1 hypothetical protein [Streptomyces sp. TBY4]
MKQIFDALLPVILASAVWTLLGEKNPNIVLFVASVFVAHYAIKGVRTLSGYVHGRATQS